MVKEQPWHNMQSPPHHYHYHCHGHNYHHYHHHHLVEEEGKVCSLNGVGKVGVVHHNQWRFPTKLKGHPLRIFQ